MSSISGKKREQKEEFVRKIGLFEGRVIAINPSVEEYTEILGMELKEDSKATEYLGESTDGNKTLRVDVWLEEIKNGEKYKAVFFLEDKKKDNKEGTKQQYINAVGVCSWADDPNNLPEWFVKREYREAYVGEEDLYSFLRTWLGNLDYRDVETILQLEWKQLMKGNLKDIRNQIDGELCTNIVALATVKTVEKDGEMKEYQSIYNKGFLPPYSLKQFRLVDYHNEDVLNRLKAKKTKELKVHEKFVLQVTGEYGSKDSYVLKDLKEYNSEDFLVASDKVIETSDSSY